MQATKPPNHEGKELHSLLCKNSKCLWKKPDTRKLKDKQQYVLQPVYQTMD